MSFGKAKRFNYKEPDIKVSPADYNVCVSSLNNKGCIIPRCERFRYKQGCDASKGCKRWTTHGKCNNLHSSAPDADVLKSPLKAVIEQFNKQDIRNATFHALHANTNLSSQRSRDIFGSTGDSEGFIDDDYHSYTSSDELDSLNKIEEYEFNQVCEQLQKMLDRKVFNSTETDKGFEDIVLNKLTNIEHDIEEFKENVSELNRDIQYASQDNLQLMKMKDVQNYFGNQVSLVSKNKQADLRHMIREAIRRLFTEFDKQKKELIDNSKVRIKNLLDEMEQQSRDSDIDMKQLCIQTAKELHKNVSSIMNETESNNSQDSFNYESICEILSDHLQATKNENEGLAMDNMEITLKYEDSKEVMLAQTSLINRLYKEIEDLKKYVNKA